MRRSQQGADVSAGGSVPEEANLGFLELIKYSTCLCIDLCKY